MLSQFFPLAQQLLHLLLHALLFPIPTSKTNKQEAKTTPPFKYTHPDKRAIKKLIAKIWAIIRRRTAATNGILLFCSSV